MWTRKELKEKAKQRLKMNYWRCVLAALFLSVLGIGMGSGGYRHVYSWMQGGSSSNDIDYDINTVYDDKDDGDYGENEISEDDEGYEGDKAYDVYLDGVFSDLGEKAGTLPDGEIDAGKGIAVMFAVLMVVLILFIILVVVLIIVLPIEIFIVNPLEVGIRRFFARNLKEEANIREVCYAFDHNYKNSVKIMFLRELYVFLWSLLFIIPGIIKAYEYRMIPYLLEENPDISKEEAFALSRSMMVGNRWKAFVLDLSFLGWYILSGFTFGILGIFYVNPYVAQTRAALYQKLKGNKLQEQFQEIP